MIGAGHGNVLKVILTVFASWLYIDVVHIDVKPRSLKVLLGADLGRGLSCDRLKHSDWQAMATVFSEGCWEAFETVEGATQLPSGSENFISVQKKKECSK